MVQTAIGQEPGKWDAIDRAIDAAKMWLAVDAVTMGKVVVTPTPIMDIEISW